MDVTEELIQELNALAAKIRFETGVLHIDAVRMLNHAREEHGISPKRFVRDKLYSLPPEELAKLNTKNTYVKLVAERRLIPYGQALAEMYDLKSRFGITYREFAQQKFFAHKTNEALNLAVTRYLEREGKQIFRVMNETGWSAEESESKMRSTKRSNPAVDFRKYAGYKFYDMTDAEIAAKLEQWTVASSANQRKVAVESGWTMRAVREHMARFQTLYDIIPAYYVGYRAWELSDEEISEYARQKLSQRISQKLNDRSQTTLLGQKDKFDEIYAEYVRRKFWVNRKDETFENFLVFAEGLDEAFCKPIGSGGGLGTFKVDLTGDKDKLKSVFDKFISQSLVLVEESVRQHEAVSEFYAGSVNTIRVVTVQDADGIHVVSAGIRFGNGGIVDNFSANGMVADVDVKSGIIRTPSVDKNGNVYEAHPISGKRFVGFQIPLWGDVLETVTGSMDVLPGVNYVGWDVAIGPDFVSLIEGNTEPDLVLIQAPYAPEKIGKKYLFDNWLDAPASRSKMTSEGKNQTGSQDNRATQLIEKGVAPKEPTRPVLDDGSDTESTESNRLANVAAESSSINVVEPNPQARWTIAENTSPKSGEAIHEQDPSSTFEEEVNGVVYRIGSEYAEIIGCTKVLPSDLELPASVKSKPLILIAPNAFELAEELVSVSIPGSVIEIGKSAFAGLRSLVSVHMHVGTTVIRAGAFRDCVELATVSLPEDLIELNSYAFAGCTSLKFIELPETLTVINKGAFSGASSLGEIGLPYALKRIGMEAFKNCTSLDTLYYYSMRGISDVMITDRELRSVSLPTMVEYIGVGAFQNCRRLRRMEIPREVREISNRVFAGCKRLRYVGLNNRLKSIGTKAFYGCSSLKSLRVPFGCATFGENFVESTTEIIASMTSPAAKFSQESELLWRTPSSRGSGMSSAMVPRENGEDHKRFYTPAQLRGAVERFEIRHPSYLPAKRESSPDLGHIPDSRFSYDGEVYSGKSAAENTARIMVVGDLMARYRQQSNAFQKDTNHFDFSFNYVRDLLGEADFVSGNLESTVSHSSPYTFEMEHVDARPHLNAPEPLLAAIRRAGIDCVTNAQNHVYDSGTRGVLETLDSANRCQLMHTGAYASSKDQRYLVVDLGGIRVGIVAYLDSARQLSKKANFTKQGLTTMFPYFDGERIREDIAGARAAGAEFVIANCHWGREYTAEITDRQRKFGQMVADAGADYIVGAHSHCVQPYEVLSTNDGRKVPCLWSAGNFISDINLQPPITRDTLIVDISLERSEEGSVRLSKQQLHPCRIMNLRDGDGRDYAVVPTSTDLHGSELNDSLFDAKQRILALVGEECPTIDKRQ